MEQSPTILEGYSNLEKGAYLGAIASIATADHVAIEEEKEYLNLLCISAGLSDDQRDLIMQVAESQTSDDDLYRFLDVLKTSELRFSLVSDLIAFAQSDKDYSEEEKQTVEKISQYLGVNQQQFSILDQFTKKATEEAPKQAAALESEHTTPQNFLSSLGFGDKLKNAGINSSTLIKGALGILGPLLFSRMMRRRSGTGSGYSSGGGGLLGGLGGLLGGGILGGLLGGNRGFGNAGGLLSRILGGRR